MIEYHILMDSIIAVCAHSALGTILASLYALRISRNRYLWAYPAILLSSTLLIFFVYTLIWVPRSVETTLVNIEIERYTGKPFTIAIISDLHAGALGNAVQLKSAVDVLKKRDDIDVLFLAGDILDNEDSKIENLAPLAQLTNSIPTYAVFGNHDYTIDLKNPSEFTLISGLAEYLEKIGVTVLLDECVRLQAEDVSGVSIIGTRDIDIADPDFTCLETVPDTDVVILLAHNPDTVVKILEEYPERKPDLVISGHTHGGELRLPGGIYLLPLPTDELPASYDEGLFTYENIPLFITSGVGNTISRVRTWNNPEAVILKISH